MKTNQILVRYGELSTKGKNRSSFIGRLRDNVRQTFSDLEKIRIKAERDRMFITSDDEEELAQVIERLPQVFGIQSFSPVTACELDLEAMKRTAEAVVAKLQDTDKSFDISVKRTIKEMPHERTKMTKALSSHVPRAFPEVKGQKKGPANDLKEEGREEGVDMMAEVIQGAGGLPGGAGRTALGKL